MSNDKFKNAPIHDKKAIIDMMDELEPKDMIEVVELLKSKQKKHNKQQTAVQWLHDELFKSFQKFHTIQFTMEEYQENNVKLYLQAKQIYKEEMIKFGCLLTQSPQHIIQEAYNETYGNDKQ